MKNFTSVLKQYAIISFGLFVLALGWTAFIIPSNITGGGATGIGTLIYYASGNKIPVGISYLVINVVLLVIALKVLGKNFGIKTIFGVLVASVLFTVLQKFFTAPIVSETFMAVIIGGVLNGVGIGITFSQGGSTGGTDIIALMINKYKNISPGRLMLYIDLIIITSSFFVWKDLEPMARVERMVYGYVVMAVTSYTLDLVISGAKQSLQLFIFSDNPEEIASEIVKQTGRGVTEINGKGWYSNKKQQILVVMIRKAESNQVYRIIKGIDPDAFMSVSSVMGVYGKGFEKIK